MVSTSAQRKTRPVAPGSTYPFRHGSASAQGGPAGHSDQRFGKPGNLHLFSLVRCATPAGRLDLLVPTADVPLVTWCLGGNDDALVEASVPSAGRRQRMSSREVRWRAISGLVSVAIAVLATATGHGKFAVIPMNFGALQLGMAALGRRARRSAPDK